MQTFVSVFRNKKESLIITAFSVILMIVMSASLLYIVENQAQPKLFSSIPHAMWWAVATLTTVGYGDIYPVTALGKLLSSIISILGIAFFAMPTAILASGFNEYLDSKKESVVCPHCGKKIH